MKYVNIRITSGSSVSSVRVSLRIAEEYSQKCTALIEESLNWCGTVAGHNPTACCLFGDITDMLPAGSLTGCETYTSKLEAVNRCGPLTRRLHCARRDAPCNPMKGKHAQFDVSGLPCPDMSRANQKRLKRGGPTNSVYMVHGKWASENRVPLLLVECTPDP